MTLAARPGQRVVRGPYELADPVHWTPPLSVGVYRVRYPGPTPVFDDPSADFVINLPTSGVYRIGSERRGAYVDAGRVALFARGAHAPTAQVSGAHGGMYLRVTPAVASQLARAVLGDDADPTAAWSRLAAVGKGTRAQWLGLWEAAAAGLDDDALYERGVAVAEAVLRDTWCAAVASAVEARAMARVHAVRTRLALAPEEAVPLDGLAASVGWSRFQLSRAFRGVTGQTVHEVRDALRLGLALERLRDPAVDLAELAYQLGY